MMQVWDIRQQSAAMEFPGHEDFVSDFAFEGTKRVLLATRLAFTLLFRVASFFLIV